MKLEHVLNDFETAFKQYLQASKDTPKPAFIPELRASIHDLLRARGGSRTLTGTAEKLKGVRRSIKAANVGTQAGAMPNVQMLVAPGPVEFLQDYFEEVVFNQPGTQASLTYVQVRDVSPPWDIAAEVPNAAPKPEAQSMFTNLQNNLVKVAVTELITEEALLYIRDLEAFLELRLSLAIEGRISSETYNLLQSLAAPFNTAPYAGTVTNANFLDAINLAAAQEAEVDYYVSSRGKLDIDLAILPLQYRARTLVIKNSVGDYLSPRMFNDIQLVYTPGPAASNDAFIVRSGGLMWGIGSDMMIHMNRVVDAAEERNLYRITLEKFITPLYVPRPEDNTQGLFRSVDLVTDVNTINAP